MRTWPPIDPGWHTVHEGVLRHATTRPGGVALIEGDRSITYEGLARGVANRAASLTAMGVADRDRVGVLMANGSDQVMVVLALSTLGAVHLSLSKTEAAPAIAEQAHRFELAFLISDDRTASLPPCTLIFVDPERPLESMQTPAVSIARDPHRSWKIVQSSGSTGSPKAVLQTHAMELAYSSRLAPSFSGEEGLRFLQTIDVKYSYGLRLCLNVLAAGGTVVLLREDANFTALSQLIDRHGITHICTTPFHGLNLAECRARQGRRPLSLRYLSLAGSIATQEMQTAIRRHLSPNLYVQYGANEVGYLTVADPGLLARFPSTVGKPAPGVEIEVVDESGAIAPPHCPGRLRARGWNFPTAYIDNVAATHAAFRDGWYYPGDIASIGRENEVYYHGRADNLINFNGIKIAPIDIENALRAHPAVREAVAFALHHPVYQDVPCAVVACASDTSEEELHRFAGRLLGAHSPRLIAILPEIPVGGAGKPDLGRIRSMIAKRVTS